MLTAVKLIAREAVLTCSYCDLEEVERLGALLLERLAQASAYKHPAKNSDVKTIALKGRMMAILDITNAATESYSYGRYCSADSVYRLLVHNVINEQSALHNHRLR
jgi:hypothetical protein